MEELWLLPKKYFQEGGVNVIVFGISQKCAVNVSDRDDCFERWPPGIYVLYVVKLWWIENYFDCLGFSLFREKKCSGFGVWDFKTRLLAPMIDRGEICLTEVFELFDIGTTFPNPEIISIQCRGVRNRAWQITDRNGEQNRLRILPWGVPFSERFIIERHILFEPEKCD